jgi:hypothetical protein
MAEPVSPLTCANCGTRPTEIEAKYTARLGGTHARRLTHGAGIPGRQSAVKLRSCGPWVLATATKEERQAAMREWQKAREG